MSLRKEKIAEYPHIEVRVLCLNGTIREVELSIADGFYLLAEEEGRVPFSCWMEAYAKREPLPLPFSLDLTLLSPFTQKVLNTLKTIPFGSTLSYQEVAQQLKMNKGFRAVGSACGRNPYPLFIPCHRVIRKDSSIGGFSSPLDVKKELLQFEKTK